LIDSVVAGSEMLATVFSWFHCDIIRRWCRNLRRRTQREAVTTPGFVLQIRLIHTTASIIGVESCKW